MQHDVGLHTITYNYVISLFLRIVHEIFICFKFKIKAAAVKSTEYFYKQHYKPKSK
jgi:hypothetical protein